MEDKELGQYARGVLQMVGGILAYPLVFAAPVLIVMLLRWLF